MGDEREGLLSDELGALGYGEWYDRAKELEGRVGQLTQELQVEREWRIRLQQSEEREHERVGQLTKELQVAKDLLESASSEHMRRITELEANEHIYREWIESEHGGPGSIDWAVVLSTSKEEP